MGRSRWPPTACTWRETVSGHSRGRRCGRSRPVLRLRSERSGTAVRWLVRVHQLEFTRVYDYASHGDSVVVPVVLRSGDTRFSFSAAIDTGASFCLFASGVAEALGIDLADGRRAPFRTANSGFEAYGHEVEISVLGVATNSCVSVAQPAPVKRLYQQVRAECERNINTRD